MLNPGLQLFKHGKRIGVGLLALLAVVILITLLRVIPHLGGILFLLGCAYVIGLCIEKFRQNRSRRRFV